jgi:hypothetical protein
MLTKCKGLFSISTLAVTLRRPRLMPGSDLDTVKGAAALHCRSVFGAMILAGNIGVKPRQIENWLAGRAELPPGALEKLVRELFHHRTEWCPLTDRLIDAAEPATLSHSVRDNAPSP